MLSKACSLTILSSFNTCNTILGSSVPLKRCIGSLVLGQYENGSLTKNTLSAIEVAKGYGSVSNSFLVINQRYRYGYVICR